MGEPFRYTFRLFHFCWLLKRQMQQEAERRTSKTRVEAVDKAVLAVEKPQENVRKAFSGGQNGRFLPAPKLLVNLFRRDDRPAEDKSWLDRITDALIDKLELRWEDSEEARMKVCTAVSASCQASYHRNLCLKLLLYWMPWYF